MKPLKLYLIAGIVVLQLISCDDTYRSSIPDFPVQLDLNLTSTYPTFRNSYNKYMVFQTKRYETDYLGYGGILVNTGLEGGYYAFDLSCPYEHKQTTRVKPNDLGQAICDSCGTVFNIGYGIGDPSSGPAKETLRRYKTNLSGDILYISR